QQPEAAIARQRIGERQRTAGEAAQLQPLAGVDPHRREPSQPRRLGRAEDFPVREPPREARDLVPPARADRLAPGLQRFERHGAAPWLTAPPALRATSPASSPRSFSWLTSVVA